MLYKRSLSRHAVSVRLCLSRSYIMSKRINISSNFFHLRVAIPFYVVFPYQTPWQYSDGNLPLTGASNAGGIGRNRDSESISGFTACCQRWNWPGVINSTRRRRTTVPQVVTLIAGSKRRSLLMAGDNDEMFVTRSINITPKTTEQQLYTEINL